MKNLFLLFSLFTFLATHYASAQTENTQALEAEKAAKTALLDSLQTELKALESTVNSLQQEVISLTDRLTPYPRWSTGLLGTVGFNLAGFNEWLSKDQPNTTAVTIGLTSGAYTNLQQRKYFWNNNANLALSWLKFDDRDNDTDNNDFQVAADALNVTSLFGYKLTPKLAISTLGEYRTATQDGRFNNPGYLDLGLGGTWTPVQNLVVVFHPLNYNFVFSDQDFNYESSLGLKTVATYNNKLTKNLAWNSNFSAFLSYKDASELSNWTWINTLSTAYKGIGVGLDIGLRSNKQEALAAGKDDNPLQTYYVLGLSYNLTN